MNLLEHRKAGLGMWEVIRKFLGVIVAGVAVAENAWVVRCVAAGAAAERQHGTDMPFGEVAALIVYGATAIGLIAAFWFFYRLGRKPWDTWLVDSWDRLLWTGIGLALVPVATFVFAGCGLILGPLGWFIASVLGGAVPYILLDRLL